MKSRCSILLICFGLIVSLIMCKKEAKTEQPTEAENIVEQLDQNITDAHDHAAHGGQVNASDTLLKPVDDSWQSYLHTEMWEFTKGIASGNSATDHVEGRWIDFEEGYTFQTGKWENVITVGEWSVDTSGIVHLVPTDGSDRESEWKIRKKMNSMVWSGTSKFGNNTSQYFLVRSKSIPKQIF